MDAVVIIKSVQKENIYFQIDSMGNPDDAGQNIRMTLECMIDNEEELTVESVCDAMRNLKYTETTPADCNFCDYVYMIDVDAPILKAFVCEDNVFDENDLDDAHEFPLEENRICDMKKIKKICSDVGGLVYRMGDAFKKKENNAPSRKAKPVLSPELEEELFSHSVVFIDPLNCR